jgi:hypothetical protein
MAELVKQFSVRRAVTIMAAVHQFRHDLVGRGKATLSEF